MEETNVSNSKSLLGCKFFRYYEEDNTTQLEVVRVVSFQNSEELRVINLKTKTTSKFSKDTLITNYALLKPDGYVFFVEVGLGTGIKDVIVTLFRIDDFTKGVPYCVCRQNMYDLYDQMLNPKEKSTKVGICMSIDSVPEGVEYKKLTSCDEAGYTQAVAIYREDKLDDILACVKMNKLDQILLDLFDAHMKVRRKDSYDHIKYDMGYCRTLKDLLITNTFMYDFRRAFGILEVTINLKDNIMMGTRLTLPAKDHLQKLFGKVVTEETIIKYDRDINLQNIHQSKTLLCDSNEDLYLMTYTEMEDYVRKTANLTDRMTPAEKLNAIYSISGKK